MLRFGTVVVAAMLLAGAAHGHEAEPPPPPKKETPAVPVKFFETKRGTVLSDPRGMTLYYFVATTPATNRIATANAPRNGFRSPPPTTPSRWVITP